MPENYQNESQSLTGIGFDALGWATWRNPFFTTRIGQSGWDPSGSKWKSRLNSIFAPNAGRGYKNFDTVGSYTKSAKTTQAMDESLAKRAKVAGAGRRDAMARNRAAMTASRQSRIGGGTGRTAKSFGYNTRNVDIFDKDLRDISTARRTLKRSMYGKKTKATHAARSLGFDSIDSANTVATAGKPRGFMNWVARITGESGLNAREAHLARQARTKYGAFQWVSDTFGKGKAASVRHAAGMYGLGRVLTSANVAMMAYDFTKLTLKPFELLAEVGVNARTAPVVQTGAGIRTPGIASSIRQRAIQEMQSSEYAPRNLLGQEASFLHV